MKFLKVLAVLPAPPLRRSRRRRTLDDVLDKAGDYVTAYERTFVGVVAEETYRQEVRGARRHRPARLRDRSAEASGAI